MVNAVTFAQEHLLHIGASGVRSVTHDVGSHRCGGCGTNLDWTFVLTLPQNEQVAFVEPSALECQCQQLRGADAGVEQGKEDGTVAHIGRCRGGERSEYLTNLGLIQDLDDSLRYYRWFQASQHIHIGVFLLIEPRRERP